jgi:hypothetical protein
LSGELLPGLFDIVRVRRPVPEQGIKAGDQSAVVEIFTDPEGYLVDFSYEPGYDTHELPVYGLPIEEMAEVGPGHRPAPGVTPSLGWRRRDRSCVDAGIARRLQPPQLLGLLGREVTLWLVMDRVTLPHRLAFRAGLPTTPR